MYICKHCNIAFKNKGSLSNHVKKHSNPRYAKIDHICTKCGKYISNHIQEHIEICGIQKNNLTHEERSNIVKKQWENPEYRNKIIHSMKTSGKCTGKANTEESEILRKQRISKSLKENPNAGGYRKGSGRGKGSWYESVSAGRVYLDSTWELAYAKFLDDNNTSWIRNTTKFEYDDTTGKHNYTPDFYLPETDEYIEIKGFDRTNDVYKWAAFPYKLTILRKNELEKMGII
jgi:hypothetical protein